MVRGEQIDNTEVLSLSEECSCLGLMLNQQRDHGKLSYSIIHSELVEYVFQLAV